MAGGGAVMRCEARKVVFTVFAFLILTAFASVSAAKTIYVPDDYARIQWAVDNATDGDTIVVRDGIYYENVVVNKSITLKSENGSANCILQGLGNPGGKAVIIAANNVIFDGFKVVGPGTWSGYYTYGIFFNRGVTGVTIKNCNPKAWVEAIFLSPAADRNVITNNTIEESDNGIWVDSSYNTISNNVIRVKGWGIACGSPYSQSNTIKGNKITSGLGVCLSRSNNNIIIGNTISNCKYGIYLGIYPEGTGYASYNRIYFNNFYNNKIVPYDPYYIYHPYT